MPQVQHLLQASAGVVLTVRLQIESRQGNQRLNLTRIDFYSALAILDRKIASPQAAVDAGLDVDDFAGRLSFFFVAHNNLFEEVAKFRAARRMWARIMTDRFKAKNPRSTMLRFHTQTHRIRYQQ